jgi:hypothetical protein
LTRTSLTFTQRNLRDDATCTTRRHASITLEARPRNTSATCFQVKQAIRSRHVFCVVIPLSGLWRNRHTESRLVLRPKPRNRRGDFETQITKPELPVLRPKPGNPKSLVLWPNREKPLPPVLRPNQRKPSPPILRPNWKNCHHRF